VSIAKVGDVHQSPSLVQTIVITHDIMYTTYVEAPIINRRTWCGMQEGQKVVRKDDIDLRRRVPPEQAKVLD
jgi:hypothetical protein